MDPDKNEKWIGIGIIIFVTLGLIGLLIWLFTANHYCSNKKYACQTISDPVGFTKATDCNKDTGDFTCPVNSCARQGSVYNTCGPIYRGTQGALKDTDLMNCQCNTDGTFNCNKQCGTTTCIPFDNYPETKSFPFTSCIPSDNEEYQYRCKQHVRPYISQNEAEQCVKAGGIPTCVKPTKSSAANCVDKNTGEVLYAMIVS